MYSETGTQGLLEWVSPFGNLRVNGYLRLSEAYRSLSRPSSPADAKASPVCPCLLPTITFGLSRNKESCDPLPDSNNRSRKLAIRDNPKRIASWMVFHSPVCFKKCKKLKVSFDNFSLGLLMLVLTRNMVRLRKSSLSTEAQGYP